MMVSMVSCYVRAMAPEKAFNVVGSAPYVALIDANLCESNSQTTSSSGSVVQTKKYETALVIASVNNGVLDGKIWLKGTDTNVTTKAWVSVKITGGPAKIPPFGEWEVNWCDGYNEVTKECVTSGHAKVDRSGSRAYTSDFFDNIQEERAVVGSLAADMRSGGGKYQKSTTWTIPTTSTQNVAGYYSFDTTRQYQNQSNVGRCVIPRSDEPGAKISSWETWLYDSSTGQRIDVNSGFSIKDEAGTWGYAGDWGVSIGNRNMRPGETVYKVDSAGNRQATYTVAVAKGKLSKFENKSSTLSSLDGITLRSHGPKRLLLNRIDSTEYNALSEWIGFNLQWDEASAKFYITGFDNCSNQGGCVLQSLEPAIGYSIPALTDENDFNLSHFGAYQEGTNNSMTIILAEWKEQGGNWMRVRHNVSSEVVVQIQKRTPIPPGTTTVPNDLVCIGNCVDGTLASDVDYGFITKASLDSKLTNRTYQWDSSTGMLKVGSNELDFSVPDDSYFNSGVLVASGDLDKLKCKYWNGTNHVDAYCNWNADKNLSTYYRWESGSKSWSHFTGLKDSRQQVVVFEQPITVSYKVPTTDSSVYKGKTVSIQYAGSGNLWLPGYCYDLSNGKRANCGERTGWANEFNIPFDTQIGFVTAQTSNSATRYLVKTLKRAVDYPDASDQNSCDHLRASAASYNAKTLPTKADWKNPADPSSSNFIGAWRESTAPPLIIDGELQR